MAINYITPYTDITERDDTTLESLGMVFSGVTEDGAGDALRVVYDDIKTAILAAATPSLNDYILVRDVKTSGTAGGTATSGSWETRDLTEKTSDAGGHATLSTSQVTLTAGTYRCYISAPAQYVSGHKAVLYNVTDSSNEIVGSSERNYRTYITTRSIIAGVFAITSSKTFEVRHRVQETQATSGHGTPDNFGVSEIYTIAEFWKTA